MGLVGKVFAAGGAALLGAVAISNARKEAEEARQVAQETERRRSSPLWFDPRLTERDFRELVLEVAGRTPRVEESMVNGMTVTLEVASNTGLSKWTAEIDFNDYGRLTGAYWLHSQNRRSVIPEHFAGLVQAQIESRMRDALSEPSTGSSAERTGAGVSSVPPRTQIESRMSDALPEPSTGSSSERTGTGVSSAPPRTLPQAGWYQTENGQQWWDGTRWAPPQPPQPIYDTVNYESGYAGFSNGEILLHLGLSFFTCGLWVPIWILLARRRREGR